jgi:hypothetical protein
MPIDKYYETYRELFVNVGWKQYVEEAQESFNTINLETAKDWDSFLVLKTRKQMLESIIRFEELILANEKLMEEQANLEVYDDSL